MASTTDSTTDSTPGFTIQELPIPESLDGPGGADFAATVDVRNAAESRGYGTTDVEFPADELLAHWHDPHQPQRLWAARLDGAIVARAIIGWQVDSTEVVWVTVQVHPDHEGIGIGSALHDVTEQASRDAGFERMIAYAVSPDGPGERLVPPTGSGSVPAENREVRFLTARGWRLEQVERGSRIPLPIDPGDLETRRAAAAAASADYRVHTWTGPTPERWMSDQAMLHTRMSTDAPSAGLEEPEDPWDLDRLATYDALMADAPRVTLTAVAEHVPSGRLVAFSQLAVPHDLSRPVNQEDTLVLREHRGHRLGMLLKVANLAYLAEMAPGHPSVLTWNAEENRPMLDVNEAVGFEPIGYEGAWRKDLR
jgi:GNAT superfamily N-acetyltransferase